MTSTAVRRAGPEDMVAAAEVYLRARHAAVPAIPPLVHDNADVRRWFVEVVGAEREVWVADDPEAGIVAVLVIDGHCARTVPATRRAPRTSVTSGRRDREPVEQVVDPH